MSQHKLPKLAILGALLAWLAAPQIAHAQDDGTDQSPDQGSVQGPGPGSAGPPGGGQFQRPAPVFSIASPANGTIISGPVTVSYLAGQRPRPVRSPRQMILLIDQPTPLPGEVIAPDPNHVAFPAGLTQLSVTLPPGPHTLQLALINAAGKIVRRFQALSPVSVTVQ